jgi:hypothetical protein
VYTYNPSTQEAEVGGLRVQGQPGLHSETLPIIIIIIIIIIIENASVDFGHYNSLCLILCFFAQCYMAVDIP